MSHQWEPPYRLSIDIPDGLPALPDDREHLDLEGPDTGDVWDLRPIDLDRAEEMLLSGEAT